MKYQISIRKMILSISAVLIAVILGQGLYTYLGSSNIKSGSTDIQSKSEKIEKNILPASAFTQKFLSTFEKMDTKKQQVVDLSLNNVPGIGDLASSALDDFESLSDEAKGQLDSIQKYHRSVYVDTLRQRFDAFSTSTVGVLETLADEEKPTSEEISAAVESTKGIGTLVEKIDQSNRKETEDNFKVVKEASSKNSSLASQFTWIAGVIFVILMSVVFYFLNYISALVSSIRKLAVDSNEIRKGDLNHKVEQERGDEMGELQVSFDNMRLEVKDYIENLDRKVQERTREVVEEKKKVSALLNNMKQAVIKINADLVIIPPASAYAEEVFGEDVVGKSIWDTLYSDLTERSEERVQVDTAFIAVFGEGDMQWDLSCDGLIPRVVRTKDGQSQVLRVNYAPLWDEDENLEEIMMVIEDITELERLAVEKRKNEERIGIIQEISQVPLNDLEDYFASSSKLFGDAQDILDKAIFGMEELGLLFRTLHTLKGNSRVFGLTMIGSAVHEVETHVGTATDLVRQGEELQIALIHSIQDTLFEAYQRLNAYADVANHFFKLGVDLRKNVLQNIHSDLVFVESALQNKNADAMKNFELVGARIARNVTLLENDDIQVRAERLKSSLAKNNSQSLVSAELNALGSMILDKLGAQLMPIGFEDKVHLVEMIQDDETLENIHFVKSLHQNGLPDPKSAESKAFYRSMVSTEVAFCLAISFAKEELQSFTKALVNGEDMSTWLARPQFRHTILGAMAHGHKSISNSKVVFEKLSESVGMNLEVYMDHVAKLDVEKVSFVCQEAFVKNDVNMTLFGENSVLSRFIDPLVKQRGSIDFLTKTVLNAILYEAFEIHKSLHDGIEVRQSVNSTKLLQLERAITSLKEGSELDAENLWFVYSQLSYADVRSALNRYRTMVGELAQNLQKKVNFELLGDDVALPSENLSLLLDSMVHLVRNSLDHGLETTEERIAVGKAEEGSLVIELFDHKNRIQIDITDDGKGIDADVIFAKAKEKGLVGDTALSPQEKINLIFLPGFSTKESVSDLSGRGVGMDVVKRNIETELGGHLKMTSTKGQGTKFSLEIPL